MTDFLYFQDAENFGIWLEGLRTCEICSGEKACFDGSVFYGEKTLEAICPECLAEGRLKDMDITTCSGDVTALLKQLKLIHQNAEDQDLENRAGKLTQQLEHTTPHLVSWQDWDWPAADGNYCRFIGFGSKALYNSLSGEEDAMEYFSRSIYTSLQDDSDAEYLWEEMPDNLIHNYKKSAEYSLLFYVFKSLTTDQIITMWDEE